MLPYHVKKGVETGFDPYFSAKMRTDWLIGQIQDIGDKLHDLYQRWLDEPKQVGRDLLDEAIEKLEKKKNQHLREIQIIKSWEEGKQVKSKITDYDIEMAMKASPEPLLGEPIRKCGNEWVYRSPFRIDKKPSLDFNIGKGLWIDRGTGEGGSIIDLAMRLEGCNFAQAVQKLNQYV
jgi:DNA primase